MSKRPGGPGNGRGQDEAEDKGREAGGGAGLGSAVAFELVDQEPPGFTGVRDYPREIELLIIESNRLAALLSDAEGDVVKVELLVKDRLSQIVEEVTAEVQAARTTVTVKARKAGETDEDKEVPTFGSEDARKLEVQRRLRLHQAYRALQFQDPALAEDSPELPFQPRTLLTRLAGAREAARSARQQKVRVDARLSRMRRELDLLIIDYERQQLGERHP
jgi:hypothetical protein